MYSRSNSRRQFSGICHTLKRSKTLNVSRELSEGSGATSGPKRTEFCRAVKLSSTAILLVRDISFHFRGFLSLCSYSIIKTR